jgi:hypothetical protein
MSEAGSPPFKPSWIDRFTRWLESLPGPYGASIFIIYILLSIQSQLVNWAAGVESWGVFNPAHLVYQLFTVEVLYFWNYLDRDAIRELKAFRPIWPAADREYADLVFRLSHQPARPIAALSALGIVIGAYYAYSVEMMTSGRFAFSLASFYGVLGFGVPMILALAFCYRIIRQLRIVSRLYASVSEIDLFNLEPVYALSSHTAKTGVIFLIMVYSNLLLAPRSIEIPTALVTTIAISVISFTAFVLPLRGINQRLVAKKKEVLREVNGRIKESFALLEERFDRRELGQVPELGKAIASLQHQKVFVEEIPTWPWQPGTVRGFISAMLLPILLWAIQQILGRFFPF